MMQVILNWTAVAPSAGAVWYDIFRALSPSNTYAKIGEVDASATTYIDSTVVEGNQYSYTVKAVNLSGAGPGATPVLTPGVPPAPAGLTVTVTS
jgi:hypothetical protein